MGRPSVGTICDLTNAKFQAYSEGPAAGTHALTVTGNSGNLIQTASLSLVVRRVPGALTGVLSTPSGAQKPNEFGEFRLGGLGVDIGYQLQSQSQQWGQISNYVEVGNACISSYDTNPFGFTWTDGTPTASATNSSAGVYVSGQGNGFQIAAPPDTAPRTLAVMWGCGVRKPRSWHIGAMAVLWITWAHR